MSKDDQIVNSLGGEDPIGLSSGDGTEPTIRYSVRDLLARVDGRLDQLTQSLQTLATRDQFVDIDHRVSELERKDVERQTTEIHQTKTRKDLRDYRAWFVSTVLALALILANVLPYILGSTKIH